MTKKVLWTVILSTLLIASNATADDEAMPIELLSRSEQTLGSYNLTVGVSYVPDGNEGLAVDETGLSTYTQFKQRLSVPIRLRYYMTDLSSVSVALNPTVSLSQVAWAQDGDKATASTSDFSIDKAVDLKYRLFPTHDWNPALTLSLGLPAETLDFGVSGSWVRDPVVLSASMTHALQLDTRRRRLSIDFGTGFFVNEKIRFKAVTQHLVPLGDVAFPQWSFALGIVYALDPQGQNDLYLGIQRVERGGDGSVGLALEWYRDFGS